MAEDDSFADVFATSTEAAGGTELPDEFLFGPATAAPAAADVADEDRLGKLRICAHLRC